MSTKSNKQRQIKTFADLKKAELSGSDKTLKEIMIENKYSPAYAEQPSRLLKSKGWQGLEQDWEQLTPLYFPIERVLNLADKLTKEYEEQDKIQGKRDCANWIRVLAELTRGLKKDSLEGLQPSELHIVMKKKEDSGAKEEKE